MFFSPFTSTISKGSETFSLEAGSEPGKQLTVMHTGWELSLGIALRLADQDLIIFTQKPVGGMILFEELDWPPRIRFVLPFDEDYPERESFTGSYEFENLALIEKISVGPIESGFEATIILNHPLKIRLVEHPDTYELRMQIWGSFREIIDQGQGWRLWEITRYLWDGLQHAYIAQIDPADPVISLRMLDYTSIADRNGSLQTYVETSGAIGGINGGFFSHGKPLGLVVRNSSIVSMPMLNRPAILASDYGDVAIGFPDVSCRMMIGNSGYVVIDTINSYHVYGPVLLSPMHPARIKNPFDGRKIVIENNYITDVTYDDVEEFLNRFIIWDPDRNTPVLDYASPGDATGMEFTVSNIPFQPDWAIQAGPLLVEDGVAIVDFTDSSFLPDITSGRSPRSAVAITHLGEILLFHGEGRMSLHSLGFRLSEMASLLVELGAESAMNLDGGGSSSIYINGRYYGASPIGGRKLIPNSIVFGNFQK